MDSGYHPKIWCTLIAVALQKPNREYSKPRSYRLIQLLEVLGKTLERVQACRFSYYAVKYKLFPSTQYGGITGRLAQDAIMTVTHDIEAAWNHDQAVTMLTFNITGFFDTIPHSYLLNTLWKSCIPLPMVKWVHSFLIGCKAAICLDGKQKQDKLKDIQTGVPQGSCASLILAVYFMSPLGEAIRQGFNMAIEHNPKLSQAFNPDQNSLAPLTLYVDDGSIAVSARDQSTTARMVEIAFRQAHSWLTSRGLMLNQVKNELIHFTHSTRGRHVGDGPTVTIPTNTLGELKTVKPAKPIHYLGVWLNSQLNSNEHIQRMTSKAMTAMHALRILGNSIRGMHQSHARKIYIGAIQPIATYSLLVFWKSKNGKNLKALSTTHNKCLHMITGAFKTTNITVMEIEASIPPINTWLDHRLEMEALHMSSLPSDHPIMCHVYPDQRIHTLPQTPPPLPPYNLSKRYRTNPRTKFTTCIT